MILLKITAMAGDDKIFTCSWIDGFEQKYADSEEEVSVCFLDFFDVENLKVKKLKAGEQISINYVNDGISFEGFELISEKEIDFSKINSGFFSVGYPPNLLTARIIKYWNRGGVEINWRDFASEKERKCWLSACAAWSECILYVDDLIPPDQINIDARCIMSKTDFYCAFGEAALGYRGYMGQCLDGFDECLGKLTAIKGGGIDISIAAEKKFWGIFFDEEGKDFVKQLREIAGKFKCAFEIKYS